MGNQAGFVVGGKLYPFASTQKLSDAPLVEAVTGLTFEKWAKRLDAISPPDDLTDEQKKAWAAEHGDTVAILGLMAISVRQAEPSWSRDKIAEFLGDVDFEGLDFLAAKEEATKDPPAEAPETGQERPSPGLSTESTTSAEDMLGAPV